MKKRSITPEFFFNLILSFAFFSFILYYFFHNSMFVIKDVDRWKDVEGSGYRSIDSVLKQRVFELEKNYNEEFYDRMEKVECYGMLNRRLGKRILDDAEADRSVIRGGKNMLYYAIPRPVNTEEFVASFVRLNDFLKKRGVFFAYVQAPYKHMENSTTFPPGVIDHGNQIADEFCVSLKSEGISVLDLNEIFVKERWKEEDVFFKTDTHWKIPFAFEGYRKTVDFLMSEGVELEQEEMTVKRDAYHHKKWEGVYIGSHGKRTGDVYGIRDDVEVLLPKFDTELEYRKYNREGKQIKERKGSFEQSFLFYGHLNNEDKYQDKYVVYMDWGASEDIIFNHKVKNGKKLLIIKDSFAMPMAGFLSLNFEKTVLLDIRDENRPRSIEEYLKKEEFDTVLFIASPTSMYYSPEMFLMPLH